MFPDLRGFAIAHIAAVLLTPRLQADEREKQKAVEQAADLLRRAEELTKK